MPDARFLVAESETAGARERRRAMSGRSSGETLADLLHTLAPQASCEIVAPVDPGPDARPQAALSDYDAVFLTGSSLHVYRNSPAVRRQIDFMRAVFASETPSFGSCAGLQVAVAAAGGAVRENRQGCEIGFARRIVRTEAGWAHPLLAGRPGVFDAPTIHSDEVETLPEGATLLAGNRVTSVQAAEVRLNGGVFWGVQYHPELPLREIADGIRRQASDVLERRLAPDEDAVEFYARKLEALDRDPERRDIAWLLGLDEEVTDPARRQVELRNFLQDLVEPTRIRRGRA